MKEIYENWKELSSSEVRERVVADLEIGTVLIDKEKGTKAIIVNKTHDGICIWMLRKTLKGINCVQWYRLEGRDGAVALYYKTDEVITGKNEKKRRENILAWQTAMNSFNLQALRAKS